MGIFKDRYIIFTAVFVILLLFFLQYKGDFEIGYDESRHALQGVVFYDYFRNAFSGGTWDLSEFLDEYTQKYKNLGYQAIHDPPVRAIIQAMIYGILGVTVFAARFATQIFVILGTFLLYFLALKIFRNRFIAFSTAVLYALFPHTYYFSRLSFVSIPIGFSAIGWFFFLLYAKPRKFRVRISENIVLNLDINLIISSFFLILFTLMKYQGIMYVTLFYILYILYLLFANKEKAHISNYQDVFLYIKESGAWRIFKKGFWQAIVFVIFAGPWVNFALFKQGHLKRLIWEGLQLPVFSYSVDWGFTPAGEWSQGFLGKALFAPVSMIYYSKFIALFALIPVLIYIFSKDKKEAFIGKHMPIFIWILSVYLVFSFVLSQHQLRHGIQMVPFIIIAMVAGIIEFSNFIRNKVGFRVFALIFIITAAIFVAVDIGIANSHMNDFGKEDNEIIQYFKEQPLPRLVVNLRPRGEYTKNYYYSPDMFMFKAISSANEFKPDKIPQIIMYANWEDALEVDQQYIPFRNSVNDADLNRYIVMFRFASHDNLIVPVSEFLNNISWTSDELENWIIYKRLK